MNDMVDMTHFVEAKSDQLNADDLIGTSRTITVRKVTGESGDQPISVYYEGDNNKPFKPCKTMRRVLLAVWGKFANEYVGRSMTIYRDDGVTFGGLAVGGIRISHMSHIEKPITVVVMKTKGKKAGIEIHPLANAPAAKPDKAADGAKALIERVEAGEDIAADPQVVKQREYLAKNRPELAAQVDEAMARLSAAADPEDPFGLPPVDHREGRDDTDMGEGFNDDPPADPDVNDAAGEDPRAARLATTRAQIAAATNERGLQAVDREWQKHSAAYDDAEVADINGLIAARRKELG